MILENSKEQEAFRYIIELASELTSKRGCNDLEEDMFSIFKNEKITRSDTNNKSFEDNVKYDFDIIEWLMRRIKKCQ